MRRTIMPVPDVGKTPEQLAEHIAEVLVKLKEKLVTKGMTEAAAMELAKCAAMAGHCCDGSS